MAPRRKDNESDKRTLTQDMPILLCMFAPLVVIAVYHPHGGGYRPTEASTTGGLRMAGIQAEAVGREVAREVTRVSNNIDATLIKLFHDIEDARNAQSAHRTVYTAGIDQQFGDGVEARLRALRQMKGIDNKGREIPIPQNIVRDRDTSRFADTPDEPEPSDEPKPAAANAPSHCFDHNWRGYDVAPGVTDDPPFCPPVMRAQEGEQLHFTPLVGPAKNRPNSQLEPTSLVASASPPIYLMPPQITEPVKRRLSAYAAGVNIPLGKATDWLKGFALVGLIWLAMKWAQRNKRNASWFIVGGPAATMALWVFGW